MGSGGTVRSDRLSFLAGVALYIAVFHIAARFTDSILIMSVFYAALIISCFLILRKMELPEVISGKDSEAPFTSKAKLSLFSVLLAYASTYSVSGILGLISGGISNSGLSGYGGEATLLFMAYAVILAPAAEEMLFRGVLLQSAERTTGSLPVAVILSSALFAMIHGSIWQIAGAFVFGIVLGFIFSITRSLELTVFIHGARNLLAVMYPGALTGNGYRNASDIAFIVVSGAAAIYIAVRMYQLARSGGRV